MTMLIDLPPALTIPATTAATIRFMGQLSARDISFAITAAWLAAHRPDVAVPVDDCEGLYDISDNGLRAALGLGRRQGIEREEDRFNRFNVAAILVGEDELPVPTLFSMMLDKTYPIRAKGPGGTYRWSIDPRLVAAMKATGAEPVVRLPTHLIRNAKSRWSVQMMAWIGAWFAGHIDSERVYRRDEDSLVLRMRPETLLEEMWKDITMSPTLFIRDVLDPIAEDITAYGDHVMAVEALRTKYRGGRTGKLQALQISIHRFVTDATKESFDEKVKRIAAERLTAAEEKIKAAEAKPSRAWKRPVRRPTKKVAEAPADVSNVVSLPVDKMQSLRPAFDQQYPGNRFAMIRPPGQSAPSNEES